MDEPVLDAFREAAASFVLIQELQEAASDVIARITGAEAGYVTSGAAAAIVLATAACIAGLDADKMDALPHTSDMPNGVLIQSAHRNAYDHMVRAAGARLVKFGNREGASAEDLRAACDDRVVAAFYHAEAEHVGLPPEQFIDVAHDLGLPVIVDAAMNLPPQDNLRRYIALGADLVAFSGGKAIRGPQSTGFLAGRQDLLLSAALQHQDMDVLPATWHRRHLLEQGALSRPPEHGIGRSMKVGKEDVAALLVALERYVERDHDAEYRGWLQHCHAFERSLSGLRGLTVSVEPCYPNGRPVPSAVVVVHEAEAGIDGVGLVRRLADRDPAILVNDYEVHAQRIRLNPENLSADDVEAITQAFYECVPSHVGAESR
jgi:L-seryl-tRNA(Ser) seleniumtransferase